MLDFMKVLTFSFVLSTGVAFGLTGCDVNQGPAEQAGEKLDAAASDMGNAIEDGCENLKEGVGADDTDC